MKNTIEAKKLEILSSNQPKTEKIEMIEGIKKRLIEDMNIGKKFIKREDIQKRIADERKTKKTAYPAQMIIGGKKEEIKEGPKYKDLIQQYKEISSKQSPDSEIKFKNLDKQLAEQMILNSGNTIEFSSKERYESGKTAQEEAKDCYARLDKMERFHDKIELIKKLSKNESFFVIKRTKKQLDQIEQMSKNIDEKMKSEQTNKEVQKETSKESAVAESKTKLEETINEYIEKIKILKDSNESEKEQLIKEIEAVKAELKKVKEEYESAKNNLFGSMEYKPEELKKMSTRRIRGFKKEVQGGVVSYKIGERLKFSTIKRRMTVNKLVKKFNEIGDTPIDGVRFIMGFEKARFLRYTGVKLYTKTDKMRSKLGLKMNPKTFHKRFTTGKNNIFAILDKGERTSEEQTVIDALKKRIEYYGHAYARQRATARTNPFTKAEKKQ